MSPEDIPANPRLELPGERVGEYRDWTLYKVIHRDIWWAVSPRQKLLVTLGGAREMVAEIDRLEEPF